MTLWNEIPESIKSTPLITSLKNVLEKFPIPDPVDTTDPDGTNWTTYTYQGINNTIWINTLTGQTANTRQLLNATDHTPLFEIPPDPQASLIFSIRKDNEAVRLNMISPATILHTPFLRGAKLDDSKQLIADPTYPEVKFYLPALQTQLLLTKNPPQFKVLRATATDHHPTNDLYDIVKMEPSYALIGPGNVVGFGFMTGVLDLSGTSGPEGVPVSAKAQANDWQGLYLSEVKLYLAPQGLEGLAMSAGARNLWIGLGVHAGVTGIFEAEIINRGAAPHINVYFQKEDGLIISVDQHQNSIQLPTGEITLIVEAGGGLAPYQYSTIIDYETTINNTRIPIQVGSTPIKLKISVVDTKNHRKDHALETIQPANNTIPPIAPNKHISLIQHSEKNTLEANLVIISQTENRVTLGLAPTPLGTLKWGTTPDNVSTAGTSYEIELADNPNSTSIYVTCTQENTSIAIDAYMLFDRPREQGEHNLQAYANNEANIRTLPANSSAGFPDNAPYFLNPENLSRLVNWENNCEIIIEGYASYEGDNTKSKQDYNKTLSKRRAQAIQYLLHNHPTLKSKNFKTTIDPRGHTAAIDSPVLPQTWWRATLKPKLAQEITHASATLTYTTHLPPVPTPDASLSKQWPDCFHELGFRIELARGIFIRAQVYGKFDVVTAAEQQLDKQPLPKTNNPSDGICQFLLQLSITEDRSSWNSKAEFRANRQDTNGLVQSKLTHLETPDAALNTLGTFTLLGPLLTTLTPPSPKAGDLVPLTIASGAASGVANSGVITVHEVTLYGGELVVTDGLVDPTDSSRTDHRTQTSLLLDVETAFTADLKVIKIQKTQPIRVRYQAMGVRSTWETKSLAGSIIYIPLPVYDPSRGYNLDIPAGAVNASPPFDQLLKILGVRVSRDNPTYLELELTIDKDLGPVKVDTARIRVRLDQAEFPQISKLCASIDIPNTIHGKGLIEITANGFKGAFDITLPALNIRGAAQLAVETKNGITGLLVGLEVEFPIALPLGNSGLGIYGFMGGIGVNYQRNEPANHVLPPALAWLSTQLNAPRNSVMHPDGWQHSPDHYAIAAGILLGTMEGGFITHTKGLVVIEAPGPRLLLVVKADVLKLPPVLNNSDPSAGMLAALDINFGTGTITLGLIAEYSIVKLLKIRVPISAFFNTQKSQDWFVYLGQYHDPVSVKVLDIFSGIGYLMIDGMKRSNKFPSIIDQIPNTASPIIAVGFHLEAKLIGNDQIYLKAAVGFDAILSLKPLSLVGEIYAKGELRLYAVSIGAQATLKVFHGSTPSSPTNPITYIHGKVCGKVDFVFFSIKGCVSLTIGSSPNSAPRPIPLPLVASVKLLSRSPALVEGSGVYIPLDAALGEATMDSTHATVVPLDAMPVVVFDMPLITQQGYWGNKINGATTQAPQWVRQGEYWLAYQLEKITLTGELSAGEQPITWCHNQPNTPPTLALLSWIPTLFQRAIPYGEALINSVAEYWGNSCQTVAHPSPIMWTFNDQIVGSSLQGWTLAGLTYPDQEDTYRCTPCFAPLQITEGWRCGNEPADNLQNTQPARIEGGYFACDSFDDTIYGQYPWKNWHHHDNETLVPAPYALNSQFIDDLIQLHTQGKPFYDSVHLRHHRQTSFTLDPNKLCQGAILRSPTQDWESINPFVSEDTYAFIKEIWGKTYHSPTLLENMLTLTSEEELAKLTLLLLVPSNAYQHLHFRLVNGNQEVIDYAALTYEHKISDNNPLPQHWLSPDGAWFRAINQAGHVAGKIQFENRSLEPDLFLLSFQHLNNIRHVHLGWERSAFQGHAPAFWIVAIEGLTQQEQQRYEWDLNYQETKRQALSTALTQDASNHALLKPDTDYKLEIGWSVYYNKSQQPPHSLNDVKTTISPLSQTFYFRTVSDPDTLDVTSLKDLTPWVLATSPSYGEAGIFCQDKILIALAHENVQRLFNAYGFELRVVVKAASGKHPKPLHSEINSAPLTLPTHSSDSSDSLMRPAKTLQTVLTPWQQAASEVAQSLPCIDTSKVKNHSVTLELPYDFEPLTDYILDIERVLIKEPMQVERVYRLNFTTSRFSHLAEFKRFITDAAIEHVYVEKVAFAHWQQANSPHYIESSGAELDRIYLAAGLNPPLVPRYPRVQIFWSDDLPAQPVALVIESSEALWRSRPLLNKINPSTNTLDPLASYWSKTDEYWLKPVRATGLDNTANIQTLVKGAGGTRALLVFAPNQRDKLAAVDLIQITDLMATSAPSNSEPIIRISLDHAPWEETL